MNERKKTVYKKLSPRILTFDFGCSVQPIFNWILKYTLLSYSRGTDSRPERAFIFYIAKNKKKKSVKFYLIKNKKLLICAKGFNKKKMFQIQLNYNLIFNEEKLWKV